MLDDCELSFGSHAIVLKYFKFFFQILIRTPFSGLIAKLALILHPSTHEQRLAGSHDLGSGR